MGTWEIARDHWRAVAERVAQAQANQRQAGAAILLGVERVATDGTLAAITAAIATLAEQE